MDAGSDVHARMSTDTSYCPRCGCSLGPRKSVSGTRLEVSGVGCIESFEHQVAGAAIAAGERYRDAGPRRDCVAHLAVDGDGDAVAGLHAEADRLGAVWLAAHPGFGCLDQSGGDSEALVFRVDRQVLD